MLAIGGVRLFTTRGFAPVDVRWEVSLALGDMALQASGDSQTISTVTLNPSLGLSQKHIG